MSDTKSVPSGLPTHIEHTIRSIAQLHAEHHQSASPLQHAVNRMTALFGRPWIIGVLTVIVIGWICLNLLIMAVGYPAIDPAPFHWLRGAISLTSLYLAILILATQSHEDQLAQHREQLTLELVVLSEQKTAKVIQLLEELRRDTPIVRNRVDQEAEDMAQPANALSVSAATKEVHGPAAASAPNS